MPKTIYIRKPKICIRCGITYTPSHHPQKYCSKKCWDIIQTTIQSISCKQCSITFKPKMSKQKFCSKSCAATYNNKIRKRIKNPNRHYRDKYKFTWCLWDYPDLFDIEYLNKVGLYSNGKGIWKNKPINLNGLVRDHKVSAIESYKNNYDPYYICHPLNCQLIPHLENLKKGSNSSISYKELIGLVENYQLNQ